MQPILRPHVSSLRLEPPHYSDHRPGYLKVLVLLELFSLPLPSLSLISQPLAFPVQLS